MEKQLLKYIPLFSALMMFILTAYFTRKAAQGGDKSISSADYAALAAFAGMVGVLSALYHFTDKVIAAIATLK